MLAADREAMACGPVRACHATRARRADEGAQAPRTAVAERESLLRKVVEAGDVVAGHASLAWDHDPAAVWLTPQLALGKAAALGRHHAHDVAAWRLECQ